MSDSTENFRNMVAGDDRLKARWEAVSDKIVSDASRLLGVQLSREDVVALPSARIATLTDEPLQESYLSEVKQLEGVQEQVRQKELKEALERGEEEAHAELARLPRYQRMARWRDMGAQDATTKPDPSSVADEATLLRRLLSLSPAERMAKAREWGIGGLS